MLAVIQYALSWPDLLVSDIYFIRLLLENIPHVCEPCRDTNVSLLFFFGVCLIFDVFYFYLFYFIHRQHVPIHSVDGPMCA
jgi:hypothetical protein